MKNILAIFGLLFVFSFLASSHLTAAENNTVEVKIKTSAVCESCKARIEKVVNKMEGVVNSDLNLEDKVLTVNYDKTKINVDEIRNKIRDTGYNADEVKKDERAYKKLPGCCK
jgi:copper chaperone CopZ